MTGECHSRMFEIPISAIRPARLFEFQKLGFGRARDGAKVFRFRIDLQMAMPAGSEL